MGNLNETPSGNRLHIGIYGKTNSGKSSLINAVTKQEVSIVADVAGTTTDPVYKPMEIHPLGPCVIIDTAGFDDESELGIRRVEKTHLAAEKTDIAVVVLDTADVITAKKAGVPFKKAFKDEAEWISVFAKKHTPVLIALNKIDEILLSAEAAEPVSAANSTDGGDESCRKTRPHGKLDDTAIEAARRWVYEENQAVAGKYAVNETGNTKTGSGNIASDNIEVVAVSALKGKGIDSVISALTRLLPEDYGQEFILGNLVEDKDLVLLVMPQDIQAPKGRLILPQVQTIRELLDRKCLVMSTTTDRMIDALAALSHAPKLIVTDSQVFGYVYENKPKESMLTSFSVLFAAYKGDLPYYVESAKAIDALKPDSKVLIAECCTHAPLAEDIGRVKLPGILKKRVGESLTVDITSGTDFPENLSQYDLIIQCGACMFNRKYVLSRIDRARQQHVAMTNYGVAIAHLTGILDKVSMPE
ncbi:[FeFe] hydrogenase H-cluster maturation GTPase HydF [Agathobacter sp.]